MEKFLADAHAEELFALSILRSFGLCPEKAWDDALDAAFLESPGDPLLLELEEAAGDANAAYFRLRRLFVLERAEFDAGAFGRTLLGGLSAAYRESRDFPGFAEACAEIWNDIPGSLREEEPYRTLRDGGIPLDWGDEAGARKCFEAALGIAATPEKETPERAEPEKETPTETPEPATETPTAEKPAAEKPLAEKPQAGKPHRNGKRLAAKILCAIPPVVAFVCLSSMLVMYATEHTRLSGLYEASAVVAFTGMFFAPFLCAPVSLAALVMSILAKSVRLALLAAAEIAFGALWELFMLYLLGSMA